MDIFTAIKTRRSLACDPHKPVAPEVVAQVCALADYAPNHKHTKPWRLKVFAGEERSKLADAWAAYAQSEGKNPEIVREKPYRAPVVIAVWNAVGRGKPLPVWEEEAATAAAIQNMLLGAHALGLAAIWRSGPACEIPQIQALLNTAEDTFTVAQGDRVMAFIYLGQLLEV